MLTIPDLNRLRAFYVVYQNRSLIGAARAMNVTRSAVSQSLKALEEELHIKLFLRNSKKVIPTEPAKRLFESMEPFMADLQAVVRELETGQKIPTGHLRIGAPQDFGSTFLTEVIVDFRKKHPEITFELILAVPITLLDLLSEDKLDLAFVDNGDVHAKDYPVSITTVASEKFVLACSKKYYEEHVKNLNPKLTELRKLAFVDYLSYAPVTKIWLKHHFGKTLPDIRVGFSAESVRAVVKAVQGSFGLGVIPEYLVEADLKSGRLIALFPNSRPLTNLITLARRLERSPTSRENLFVQFFKESI